MEAVRLWKGLLVALNQAFDRQGMELLLLLRRDSRMFWFSSDGVLRFAGLIGAGLVAIVETDRTFKAAGDHHKFTQTSHNLALTEKGSILVEAWLAGNEPKYRELISASAPGGPPH